MSNSEQEKQLQKNWSYLEEQFLTSEELQKLNEAIYEYLTYGKLKPLLLAGIDLKAFLGRMSRSVVISGQETRTKKRKRESNDESEVSEILEGVDSTHQAHRTKDSEEHRKKHRSTSAEGKLESMSRKVQPRSQAPKASSSTDLEEQEQTVTLIQYSSPEEVEPIKQIQGRAVVKPIKATFLPRKIKSILKVRHEAEVSNASDDDRAMAHTEADKKESKLSRHTKKTKHTEVEEKGERIIYSKMTVPKISRNMINKTIQLEAIEAAQVDELQLENLVFTDVSSSTINSSSRRQSGDFLTVEDIDKENEKCIVGSDRMTINNQEVQVTSKRDSEFGRESLEFNITGTDKNQQSEPQKKFWICLQRNKRNEFSLTVPKIVMTSSKDEEKQQHLVVSGDMLDSNEKQLIGFSKEMSMKIEEKRNRFISPEDVELLNRHQRLPVSSESSDTSDHESTAYFSSEDDFTSTDDEGLGQGQVMPTGDVSATDEEEYTPFGAYDPILSDDKQVPCVRAAHTHAEDESDILPREYAERIGSELLTLEQQSDVVVGCLRLQLSIITNALRQGKKIIGDQLKTDAKVKKKVLKHRFRQAKALNDFFRMDEDRAFSRELGRMAKRLKQSFVHQPPASVNLVKPDINMENVGVLKYTSWFTPIEEYQILLKDKLGRVEGDVKGFYALSESGRFLSIDKGLTNSTKKFESLSVAWNGKLALMSTGKTDIVKISILTDHFTEYENLKILHEVKSSKQLFCVFNRTTAFVTSDQVRFYLKNSKNVWNYELKKFKPENCFAADDLMYLIENETILEINSETRDTVIYKSVSRSDAFSIEMLLHFVRSGFRIFTTAANLHVFNPESKKCYYYLMDSTFKDKLLLSYYKTSTDVVFCLRSKDDYKSLSIQRFPLEETCY